MARGRKECSEPDCEEDRAFSLVLSPNQIARGHDSEKFGTEEKPKSFVSTGLGFCLKHGLELFDGGEK